MEKRSRRRTRDLVTQAASQGLSENEIGCARISMMARSTNAPCKGRIQMRKTKPLHFFTFGLQRTAGPYSWVTLGSLTARPAPQTKRFGDGQEFGGLLTGLVGQVDWANPIADCWGYSGRISPA